MFIHTIIYLNTLQQTSQEAKKQMENKSIAETFGDRLRSERLRLGFTQEQLAQEMGVKKLTVLQYEKGSTQPQINLVYKLQNIGFNMQFLFFADNSVFNLSSLTPETLEMITRLVSDIEQSFGGGTFTDLAKFRMHLILLNKYLAAAIPQQLTDAQATELLIEGHNV